MLRKTVKLATVGAALGAVALLSACSGQNSAAPASYQSAPVNVAAKSQVQQPETPVKKGGSGGGGASAEDVNCSTLGGPVGPRKVDLIADETKAGTVGCVEAFNVITEYFDNIDKAIGSNYMMTVRGWQCLTDTGAEGTHEIRCAKDGFKLHTTPPKDEDTPDPQEQGTGYNGVPIDPPADQDQGTGYHGVPVDPPNAQDQGTGYQGVPVDSPDQN
ncbi:hypothetical protein [Amycolatopsis sp. La24]|uniref:hypothetical protein n=1 Tax=Amycolatopsis sp. La24 TaxID=3028304 RepID=UPI0023AE7E87|nr:hypothetical protein [Amycolatopsis sp. La24]